MTCCERRRERGCQNPSHPPSHSQLVHTVLRRVVLGLAGPQHGEVAPLGAGVEVADERRAALLRDQRDLVGDLVGGLCLSVENKCGYGSAPCSAPRRSA